MEKFKVSFEASNQQLKALGTKHASDTYADIEATFVLGERWTDMNSVSAVWWNDFTRVATVLDSQGKCIVPHEVLARKGCVRVNLVGSIVEGNELVTRLTSYSAEAVQVNEKIKLTGNETSEITPSQFEQFVAAVISEVEKVTGMTAQAETLPAGSQATARYENGILYLGIPQGIQGERGETGADGNGIASVVYNADYSLTLVFDNGERFTTPPIRGERGPAGADGRDGTNGRDGADGVTPSLSVGTVTTLPSTEDAYVTRTGTDENPVFDFGIPQGPKGDKGDTGEVSQAEFDEAVSNLKSDLATTYIYENRFTSANWEQGEISPVTGIGGGPVSTGIRLNSTSFIENARSIKAKSGYKFAVAAFDSEGTYVGTWNGTTWAKNWGWIFITEFSLVEYPDYKFRVTMKKDDGSAIAVSEFTNLLVSYKDASQNLYSSVESLDNEIKNLKAEISLDGMGNTFVGNVVYDNVVSANAVYRLYVDEWSVDGITPSASATLFEAGYEDGGTYTRLIQITTDTELSRYYDIYIPSTASEPKIYVGGRIESGATAFVNIEPLEINDIINADYNRPYDAYAVLNGKGNTFTSVLTDYTLYKGDIYRVYINKWNHTQATTPSSYMFQIGYEDGNENRVILTGYFVGDTIPDFVDVELPYNVESGTLFIGGRTDNNDFAIVSVKNLTEQLPEFVEQAVSSLNNSLMSHQTSNSISFPFITDIHIGKGNLMDDVLGAMLRSKYAINAINKVNPLDFCVFNGDYLFNTNADSKAKLLNYYDQLERAFSDLDVIKWMGKGNHDINDANPSNALTDEEYYQHCFKYSAVNRFVMDYDEMQKCYGYYDDANRRIRFIFINTVDIPSSGYIQQHTKGISNKQLNFIAKALEFDEENWGVVFVSHHALQNNAVLNPTDSDDGYLTSEHGGTPLMGIINAFVNKTSYSFSQNDDPWVYQVSVDYSGNASSEVIAMFSGHMHRDCLTTVNGYVMMSVSSGGLTVEGYDANGNRIGKASKTITETSWDVITIDRLNKMVYADRYGGGISRSIAYGN